MDSLQRVAVVFAVVAAAAWTMVAYSVAETLQAPPELRAPAETFSPQTVPEAVEPGISGSSTEPLSDRLDRSRGVLRPPGGIDPGLTQSPPPSGPHSTPALPPPGTPGGRPGVNPK
jgi:hypothetical protein